MERGMTNGQTTIYVGIDVSKDKLAVAIADGDVRDEVLSLGVFENAPASVEKLLKRLSGRALRVAVCYEAGPTGYGLYRQVRAFGFECDVVAPSLIPVRAGERVKTDRLDAIRLARLLRAGELTPIWVPDETHEAMRDLVRARESAAEDQRHKRQLVSAFLLRHGRTYHRSKPWTMRYRAGGCKARALIIRTADRPSGDATSRAKRDGTGRPVDWAY
jgi:transposase